MGDNIVHAQFPKLSDLSIETLAAKVNEQGYVCIPSFISDEQLTLLQEQLAQEADRHDGQYFAHHGDAALAGSLLVSLKASPNFQALLAEAYRLATGNSAPSREIFPVLRCVQGDS